MDKKKQVSIILSHLEPIYPDAKTELKYDTPFQLLVATILSAQCTDVRVNIVTNDLFRKYKTPKDFAGISQAALEKEIHSTGFYRNKAKNIIAASKIIAEKYSSRLPDTMEELITLSGVARKTANVVLSVAFNKTEGIAVDTHVVRLSSRLGLSENKDPNKIEKDLMALTEKENWKNISNLLILHGRRICAAKKPKCDICVLNKLCPGAFRI
ncbi:MAG: endonuclease III [archaeon]